MGGPILLNGPVPFRPNPVPRPLPPSHVPAVQNLLFDLAFHVAIAVGARAHKCNNR